MTKLWFKTKNDQIVDLNRVAVFGISNYVESKFVVCCDVTPIHLAKFDKKEEAQAYLEEIYQNLITNSVDSDMKLVDQKPHPWEEFLKARKKAMVWAFEVMGQNYEEIARQFSMDKIQVALIMSTRND